MHKGEDGDNYYGTACNKASTDISWRRVPLTWKGVSVSYNLFCRSGYTGKYKIWQAWGSQWWSSG